MAVPHHQRHHHCTIECVSFSFSVISKHFLGFVRQMPALFGVARLCCTYVDAEVDATKYKLHFYYHRVDSLP